MSAAPTFIFDWSGTLCNNFPAYLWVCSNVFKDLGREAPTADEVRRHFTLPYMKFYNSFFPDLTKEKADALYTKYAVNQQKCGLYDGIVEVLGSFHAAGCKLFVLSSDLYETLNPDVERTGLSSFFTKVYGGVHDKGPKLKSITSEHLLDPKNTYYIGDTSGDIEAGKAAGVHTVGISWGYQHQDILAKSEPDHLIDDIVGLKTLL